MWRVPWGAPPRPCIRRRRRIRLRKAAPRAELLFGELVVRAVSPRRFMTLLLGGFACAALVLAAIIFILTLVYFRLQRRLVFYE